MRAKILMYNALHDYVMERNAMSEIKKTHEKETVGQRLARLRTERGYTQRNFAKEMGISHRMIAYYEKQAQNPPAHVMPLLAKALDVSIDQLFGIEKIKTEGKNKDMRLWRRFSQIEKLDVKEKRQVIQLLDTFIEKEQLKQKAQI
jgi:transcriptional regulator with XRE-family HTH domain